MRFKDYLREARHREDVSVEKAIELIKAHCKDARIGYPLWRGTKKAQEEAYVIQGDLGERTSANTTNHYSLIMDQFLPAQGYPARGKSIILAAHDNIVYARTYGKVYAIFPYDGVPIGVVPTEDIWYVRFKMGGETQARTMEKWNEILDNAGVTDFSYYDLVEGIKETLSNDQDESYDMFDRIFGSISNVEDVLEKAYSAKNLGLRLTTSKERIQGDRELWIGGKCVALRHDIWEKVLDKMGKVTE